MTLQRSEIFLLSKFLNGSSLKFGQSEYWAAEWKRILGRPIREAIEWFVHEGILIEADKSIKLDIKLTIDQIKKILKKNNIPKTGNKIELIKKLIDCCGPEIEEFLNDKEIYQCSFIYKEIAEKFIQNEKNMKLDAIDRSLEFIRNFEFDKAAEICILYERYQFFPRGIGVNWNIIDPKKLGQELEQVYNCKPKILVSAQNDLPNEFRIISVLSYLWADQSFHKKLPADIRISKIFDNQVALRMMNFSFSHQRNFENFKKNSFIKCVKIVGCTENSCSECKNLNGKVFELNELPELPFEKCTGILGCRCQAISIINIPNGKQL